MRAQESKVRLALRWLVYFLAAGVISNIVGLALGLEDVTISELAENRYIVMSALSALVVDAVTVPLARWIFPDRSLWAAKIMIVITIVVSVLALVMMFVVPALRIALPATVASIVGSLIGCAVGYLALRRMVAR